MQHSKFNARTQQPHKQLIVKDKKYSSQQKVNVSLFCYCVILRELFCDVIPKSIRLHSPIVTPIGFRSFFFIAKMNQIFFDLNLAVIWNGRNGCHMITLFVLFQTGKRKPNKQQSTIIHQPVYNEPAIKKNEKSIRQLDMMLFQKGNQFCQLNNWQLNHRFQNQTSNTFRFGS